MSVASSIAGGGGGAGGGGVEGPTPASSTDNAVARWDGTGGDALQNSVLTVSDAGVVAGATQLDVDNLRLDGSDLSLTSGAHMKVTAPGAAGNGVIIGLTGDSNSPFIGHNGANYAIQNAGVGIFSWSPGNNPQGAAADTALARNAAGVVRVTNGTTGLGSTLTGRLVEANIAGAGSPNILTANESRTLLTNEGTTAMNHHTLPAAVAGLEYIFAVQDADGITITAGAGDTIRVAGSVSAAGGTAANSTIGSVLHLVALNATEWFAVNAVGTWTLT